jgi:hypothetical protein
MPRIMFQINLPTRLLGLAANAGQGKISVAGQQVRRNSFGSADGAASPRSDGVAEQVSKIRCEI